MRTHAPLAVVTGASSGIGREIAHSLAQRGYRTVLIARRHALLRQLADQLSAHAPSSPAPADLAELASIPALAADIEREHGPARVLVNCAGVGSYASFLEQHPDEFGHLLRVNFEAPVLLTRALLPGMLAHAVAGARGHVLNVASMSARMGPWGHAAYAAAKGALKTFTECLHAEHARHHVGFTVVYPGIVNTEYFRHPAMRPLWPRVAHRAIDAGCVARAAVNTIGTGRVAVYVPRHYRALDTIVALSPTLAARLVRRESSPRAPAAERAPVVAPPLTSGT